MGKKKVQSTDLGRSIIKARFGGRKSKTNDSFLHTSELQDGYDWGRLNLQSVTEQSHLEDFLSTAELAGTEFAAEKLNVKFVNPDQHSDLLSPEEEKIVKDVQEKHKQLLRIPRRPEWNERTTAEELDKMERDQFLEWRRELAQLQDMEHLILTPFERNLDFWRQLWRVIERSDIIVQIVDGRNPLLFRCEDLEKYIKEIDDRKVNMILINKADLLTAQQRTMWATYFDKIGIRVAFWSATLETERQNEKEETQYEDSNASHSPDNSDSDDTSDMEDDLDHDNDENITANTCPSDVKSQQAHCNSDSNTSTSNIVTDNVLPADTEMTNENLIDEASGNIDTKLNNSALLNGDELVDLFKNLYHGHTVTPGVVTVGLVGYPNVGKSSSINAILRTKKVPVSATPGRTKHFQTLYLDPSLMLCDCPGLVMPTFVSTKADMVISGILPIDQMRDHVPPVSLVCQLIHRDTLEATYTINIPPPREGEDPQRAPTANELLMAYGYSRGYMTSRGIPDCPRSSRYILKDYVNGKLLYCHCPPGGDVERFQPTPPTLETKTYKKMKEKQQKEEESGGSIPRSHIDQSFFTKEQHNVHSKGVHGVNDFRRLSGYTGLSSERGSVSGSSQSISDKPWKKHSNRNRKEKSRRIYKDTTDMYY